MFLNLSLNLLNAYPLTALAPFSTMQPLALQIRSIGLSLIQMEQMWGQPIWRKIPKVMYKNRDVG